MKFKEVFSRVVAFLLELIRPSVSKIVGEFDRLLVKLDKLIDLHERKISAADIDIAMSYEREIDFADKETRKRASLVREQARREEEKQRAKRIRDKVSALIS
jgi:hypothetical protein